MKKFEKLEIDIPNKKFSLNGEEFGKGCTELKIQYKDGKWSVERTITERFSLNGDEI